MSNDNNPLVNPTAVSRIMERMDVESEEARVFITMLLDHYEAGGSESLIDTVKEILEHYKELKHIWHLKNIQYNKNIHRGGYM